MNKKDPGPDQSPLWARDIKKVIKPRRPAYNAGLRIRVLRLDPDPDPKNPVNTLEFSNYFYQSFDREIIMIFKKSHYLEIDEDKK